MRKGILHFWWYCKLYLGEAEITIWVSPKNRVGAMGVGVGSWHLSACYQRSKEWGNNPTSYREDGIRVGRVFFILAHGWLLGKPFAGVGYPENDPNDRFYRVDDWDVPGQKPPPSGGSLNFKEAFG